MMVIKLAVINVNSDVASELESHEDYISNVEFAPTPIFKTSTIKQILDEDDANKEEIAESLGWKEFCYERYSEEGVANMEDHQDDNFINETTRNRLEALYEKLKAEGLDGFVVGGF